MLIGLNLSSAKVTKTNSEIANDKSALLIVKKFVTNSLNIFLFKNKKIAVRSGRNIGTTNKKSKTILLIHLVHRLKLRIVF